ncbi:hypothetical protein K458DRAFT_398422 [Lentithecium fluviatile CBS 122367]|uniref:Cyanovirin-N domain-containing protein n=1 Tax=Lentithecium fluviatile CBS 122367 TaxID=1168545 RepID=A0A6G1JNS1_9PLEO|nr:hypothetical protein K458DRAFT_398422 [Lentithecium fluviatile CBS 122367]
MQLSLATLLGLLTATTLAAPAPTASANSEAERSVIKARSTPHLSFYNKLDFKQFLCDYNFDLAADDGKCITAPSCASHHANSVRFEDGVKSCSFFRKEGCKGSSDSLTNDGNFRITIRDNLASFRCDL